jgi:hypothetical protein
LAKRLGSIRRKNDYVAASLSFINMAADPPLIPTVLSFRVLGPHERGRFSPDAWGHLLGLVGTGAISGGELEHIIERALIQIDGPIALEDLRAFMDASGLAGRSWPDPNQQSVH